MKILAIDPGPEKSGWVLYDSAEARVLEHGIVKTPALRGIILRHAHHGGSLLAIEMIASYGMAVGKEVFETCVWIGRLLECFGRSDKSMLVYRKDVKLHLCGSPRATDSNIRQALIDRFGPQGTKKKPGPTYGFKSHVWPALAVAVTVADQMEAAP